jgi:hypothetical protein
MLTFLWVKLIYDHNKLECLSLAGLSSLVSCFRVTTEPARVKHLSSRPLYGKLLVLPTNIRLSWNSFPGTGTLPYYEHL